MRSFAQRGLPWLAVAFPLAGFAVSVDVVQGWNLLGNSEPVALDVTVGLSDPNTVQTVWAWNKAMGLWAFYTPTLGQADLATYAQKRGFDVLTRIAPKQGYWVNTTRAGTLTVSTSATPQTGSQVLAESDLYVGWNLLATADGKNPAQLYAGLAPGLKASQKSISTFWAWDAVGNRWRFYSPGLASLGGTVLSGYLARRSYAAFDTAPGVNEGFWVSMWSDVSTTTPTTSTTAPATTSTTAASTTTSTPATTSTTAASTTTSAPATTSTTAASTTTSAPATTSTTVASTTTSTPATTSTTVAATTTTVRPTTSTTAVATTTTTQVSTSTTSTTTSTTTVLTPTPTGGVVVDGYLKNAIVTCDTNNNGVSDTTSEVYVYSTATGTFSFPQGCASSLLASGGTNIDTGLQFFFQMKAPAGATVISPLTTLVADGATQDQVNTALGLALGTALNLTDPHAQNTGGALTNPDLLKKTLAVQQILQKVTETLAGLATPALTGSAALEPIYDAVAKAFAAGLTSGTPLVTVTGTTAAIDLARLKALVSAAGTGVADSAVVDPAVKTALTAASGPAQLATVISPALKVQAAPYLAAPSDPASITAITKAGQANSVIASSVKVALTSGQLSASTLPADLATLASTIASNADLFKAAPTTTAPATTSTTVVATTTTVRPTTTTAPATTSTTATTTTTTVAFVVPPTITSITTSPGTGNLVTFTFNFDQDVGTSFTASDVAVTNGVTAATVVKLSGTKYTLDVTPNTGATTVKVDIAPGAFAYTSGAYTTPSAQAYSNTYTIPYIFASNYMGNWALATYNNTIASVEGGSFGIYMDSTQGVNAPFWWGSIATAPVAADPNVAWGWGIDAAATKPTFFGGFVNAPNNLTASISGYTNLKITVSANSELVAIKPNFDVVLVGPTVGTCTPALISPVAIVSGQGIVQPYTLPLSAFTFKTACTYTTTDQLLAAGINSVHVIVSGANMQYTTPSSGTTLYPNGLVIGKIYFD